MAIEILEVSFRNVKHDAAIEELVQRRVERLEKFAKITSCRVAIDGPNKRLRSGSPWRIRVDLGVPPQHEVVVRHDHQDGEMHEDLSTAIINTFKIAERQLRKLHQEQLGHVKNHPEQELLGIVDKVFDGYGFIRDVEGREVYFHENSVLYEAFDDLEPGTGVTFTAELGNEGLQASTVRVVDRRSGERELPKGDVDVPRPYQQGQ